MVTFVESLKTEVGQMNLAKLQDFFIQSRNKTPDEACKWVAAWMKQQAEMLEAVQGVRVCVCVCVGVCGYCVAAFEAKNKAEQKKKAKELKADDNEDEEGDIDGGDGAIAVRGAAGT